MRYFYTLLAGTILLASASSGVADTISPSGADNSVEWSVQNSWDIEGKPLDIVHSLDHKLVFILVDTHKVHIYDADGTPKGSIPVGAGVDRIDIAPMGEMLYLIDSEENRFTSAALSYVLDIDITDSPYKGNPDGPVIITLFTDFE